MMTRYAYSRGSNRNVGGQPFLEDAIICHHAVALQRYLAELIN